MSSPIKESSKGGCCVCGNSIGRMYCLGGRKLLSENFACDLFFLLQDNNIVEQLKMVNANFCRTCYNKVVNSIQFIRDLKQSTVSFLDSPRTVKRGILNSPTFSLDSLQEEAASGQSYKESRKKLKMSCDDSMETLNISTDTEHSYVNRLEVSFDEPTEHSLEILECVFQNICDKNSSNSVCMDLRNQTRTLTSRKDELASVLYKYRECYSLVDNSKNIMCDIVSEMKNRVPHLLDVMCSVAVPDKGKVSPSIIPVIASCYSLLLKHKYNNLSAFHRLVTTIATEGGLNDRGQTRLNHLGFMLSSQRRMKFQDSIEKTSQKLIIDQLKCNPLLKITGDNLDIYINRSKLTADNRNMDLHLFTSNVIFSRVATLDMNNDAPNINISKLTADDILLKCNGPERAKLMYSYNVLLCRILCQLPYFKQFRKLIQDHLPHEYSQKMSVPSKVMPLPLQFKNETKHEDCLQIMDTYECQLTEIYQSAFGNLDLLRKFKVPLGGDQLTRARLQEVKNLRSMSVSPERRFDDLHPIVCEMWHNKQDFLEKCYKRLYNEEDTPGTLKFFKTILHRTNVNGQVKGRFQPHFDLLMTVGEGIVKEQFMEYFGMENLESKPNHCQINGIESMSEEEKKSTLENIVNDFILHYGYCNADTAYGTPKPMRSQTTYELQKIEGSTNKWIGIPAKSTTENDEIFNYSMQLCHWYLHIVELHDTAKEGDLNRTLLNCKYSVPFFYSHSKLSKYMVENIDYLMKTEHQLSPLQRIRVLEGSYTNIRGGQGNNVESDLVQEHSVCNQKQLIKGLGANKSEKAISRVTCAADAIDEICTKFDESIKLRPKSSRHSNKIPENDNAIVSRELRKIRPFRYCPGRKCNGFSKLSHVPLKQDDIPKMKGRINQIISRLALGCHLELDEERLDIDNEIEHNLPPI